MPSGGFCRKCGRQRAETGYFYRTKNGAEHRRSICKTCHSKDTVAARRKRLVDYNAHLRHRYKTDLKMRANEIWVRARSRSKARNLEFQLPRQDVERWLASGVCAVTGIKFVLDKPGSPLAPSLDRINPKIGYVSGNCRLVTWIYNRAKGDDTDADVLQMMEAINAVGQRKTA